MSFSLGFSITELLIALTILAEIATFTIPKVITSQQNGRSRAIAKETIGVISEAYTAYKVKNTPSATTKGADLTPYINYVKVDRASGYEFDDVPGGTSVGCGDNYGDGTIVCLFLANGAILEYADLIQFNGTAKTNALYFYVDADGKYGNSTTGPSKSLVVFLYFNGRIATWGTVAAGTANNGGTSPYSPMPSYDPSWFSWN